MSASGVRRRRRIRQFTHTVEGFVDGVPFCRYYKRFDLALRAARNTGGTVYDLLTLAGQRFVNGSWEAVCQKS